MLPAVVVVSRGRTLYTGLQATRHGAESKLDIGVDHRHRANNGQIEAMRELEQRAG